MNFLRRRRARFLIKRPRLQKLPGYDNEAFIRAMGVSGEGISWLWRR
jgi:hypothetical protein